MQTIPRSNRERTETTRLALIRASRALFVDKGYGATSTPEICAATGMTRGALYHHFADKLDLFRQVVAHEAEAVTVAILAATSADMAPREALIAGSDAYLAAMATPGRTRLLLIEGPAALGLAEMTAIDEANSAATLRDGLIAAGLKAPRVSVDALAHLLSSAYDRAALDIEAGADVAEVRTALLWLLKRVLG